jgi:hypothetical protein
MRLRIHRIHPAAVLPCYAHGPQEDAGMDLTSVEEVTLDPGVPRAVATGLTIELPPGWEAQVRPRSGLALKHAIAMPNAPGTIDPGYRGVHDSCRRPHRADGGGSLRSGGVGRGTAGRIDARRGRVWVVGTMKGRAGALNRGVRTFACRVDTLVDARWHRGHKRRVETRRGTHECVRHTDLEHAA